MPSAVAPYRSAAWMAKLPQPQPRRLPLVDQTDYRVEIVNREQSGDIRPGQAELAGGPQQSRQRARRAEREGGTALGGRRDPAAVPEGEIEGSLGKEPLNLVPEPSGAREGHLKSGAFPSHKHHRSGVGWQARCYGCSDTPKQPSRRERAGARGRANAPPRTQHG